MFIYVPVKFVQIENFSEERYVVRLKNKECKIRTVGFFFALQNPRYMKHGFRLCIETLHVDGPPTTENVSANCVFFLLLFPGISSTVNSLILQHQQQYQPQLHQESRIHERKLCHMY